MASLTSFYIRKHLPPVPTWNGGMAWDSALPHSLWPPRSNRGIISPSPPQPPTAQLPRLQNAKVCSIIKALLHSADQGPTLRPFPPLDLNDPGSRAERPEY